MFQHKQYPNSEFFKGPPAGCKTTKRKFSRQLLDGVEVEKL